MEENDVIRSRHGRTNPIKQANYEKQQTFGNLDNGSTDSGEKTQCGRICIRQSSGLLTRNHHSRTCQFSAAESAIGFSKIRVKRCLGGQKMYLSSFVTPR